MGLTYRFQSCLPFGGLLLPLWKIEFMNGVGGTNRHAFPAQGAFRGMDVSQVIFHGDCLELALLHAFSAANAGHFAVLFRDCSLFPVDAADKYPAILLPAGPHFDDLPWARFDTSPASNTFFLDYDR